MASTGLSLHYDLFTDRHINFFGESLDWTFKYTRLFNNSRNIEFKGHLGAVIFNANNSYFFDGYTNFRQTENDYGAGVNIKLFFSAAHKKWGKLTFNISAYEVFRIFNNKHTDNADILFFYTDMSYMYQIKEHWNIGISNSLFRQATIYNFLEDTDKVSYMAKFFISWSY
jgi:hypothetical protein